MISDDALRKKIDYNEQYRKANLEVFHVKAQKAERLTERIQAQVDKGKAASKQAYIVAAIRKALEADEGTV